MKTKITEDEIRALYGYLCQNHLGEANAIARADLAKKFDLNERTLRKITSHINSSPDYNKLVSTKNATFICENHAECVGAIYNCYKVAISQFKKARAMQEKLKLNGQIVIDVDTATMNNIIEVYGVKQ